jgi:hypothetical protein
MSVRCAPRLLSGSRVRANTRSSGASQTPSGRFWARFCLGTTARGRWEDRRMFLSFAYLAFCAVLELLVGRRRNEFAKDVELMVLRHQLVVLGRQAARPSLRPAASCPSRCACSGAAAEEATRVRRDAADAAALAQGAGSAQVGAAATKPGPPAGQRPRASARAPARTREPALGLPADRRRTAEARHACVAEHGAPAAPRSWSATGAERGRPELARLPPPASRQHARLRLLHG